MEPKPEFTITGIFREEKGGGFSAQFKEIPNAIAQGETIEEAQKNLFEVLFMVLEDMREISKEEVDDPNEIKPIIRSYPLHIPETHVNC